MRRLAFVAAAVFAAIVAVPPGAVPGGWNEVVLAGMALAWSAGDRWTGRHRA